MVRLEGPPVEKVVSASEMKNGDFAVIKYWEGGSNADSIGKIVYRYGEHLVLVGFPYGQSWGAPFRFGKCSCMVRILEKGEKIVIE